MTSSLLKRRVKKALDKSVGEWQKKQPAWLGDRSGTVSTGTAGVFFARLVNGKVIKVRVSVNVPTIFDLHVQVGEPRSMPGQWHVIKVLDDYDVPATGGQIGYHHKQHELYGSDEIQISRKQITAYTVRVQDGAGFKVLVYGGYFRSASGFGFTPTQIVDLSSYVVTAGAVFVAIEADDDGALTAHVGTAFGAKEMANASYIPVPDSGKYHIAAVLFWEGQTELLETEISVPMPLGGGGGGGGSNAAEDITIVDAGNLFTSTNVEDALQEVMAGASGAAEDVTIVDAADYFTATNVEDALQEIMSQTGTGIGGGDIYLWVAGAISAGSSVTAPVLITKPTTVRKIYAYLVNTGSVGSTIIDANRNGTTLYSNQGERPEIAFNANPAYDSAAPDVLDFVEGDVLTFDVDQAATGATGLLIVIRVASTDETPAAGIGRRVYSFTYEADLPTMTGALRLYNVFGMDLTITEVFLAVNTAPTGADIIVDINKNGTTLFTTQTNRPKIVAGAYSGSSTTIENNAFLAGQYLTMDIDQRGSTVHGSNLTVHVVFE